MSFNQDFKGHQDEKGKRGNESSCRRATKAAATSISTRYGATSRTRT